MTVVVSAFRRTSSARAVVVSAFRRTFSAVATLLLAGAPAFAQLATPNAAGVAMGHLHYSVKDLEANRQFWTMLGGRATKVGGIDAVAFADVVVLLSRGDPAGGTDGSVVNHVAFRVPSLATVEAAGLKVQRLAQFPGVASVTTPEGERIELFENAATNLTFTQDPGFADPGAERHNRPLTVPIAFHHIHLYVPVDAVPAAKSWYSRMFGGDTRKAEQLRRGRLARREHQHQRRTEGNRRDEGSNARPHRIRGRESRGVL